MKVAASVVAARREKLAASVATEGFVPLSVLCRRLGVSLATARRDLAHLQKNGRISRVRGGVLPSRHGDGTPTAEIVPPRAQSDAVAAFFESDAATGLKESLCEAARRCWRRGLVDGASGHFSARLGALFLCTPAGVNLGTLHPEMLCLVDADGRQVASRGQWKRSPEVLIDLAIYRAVPAAAAVAHAHPPHATACSFCESGPPRGLHAEFEVFAGPMAHIGYRMPGSAELAALVGEAAPRHMSILLRNHGVVCWGSSVDDAFMKLEMIEAYCRAASIAAQLPGGISPLPANDLEALDAVKRRLGLPGAEHAS